MLSSSTIVGAETITNNIWNSLMDEKLRIIALLGDGGVGKTTILKQIFNKLSTTRHFDPLIWVTVSQYLSLHKLQDDIWRKIGVFDSNWVHKSFDEKSRALAQSLSQKKFLLVLDDIWSPFQLSDIGVPVVQPDATVNDFKVIFTSRSEPVCRSRLGAQLIIKLDLLEEKFAWRLFKEKIGEHKLDDPIILQLAKLIAQQCGGLPLPLCTVARAMACRTTHEEWILALHQVLARSHKEINVGHLLNFCFDSLPNSITRSCLFYFSLFPEDFSIPKNELIDFWICEQLLGHQQDALNLGYNTIDTLVEAYLLQQEQADHVKLQDLVRDFAMLNAVMSGVLLNVQLFDGRDNNAWHTAGWFAQMGFVENIESVPHDFSTFLLYHNPFVAIKGEFSQFMDVLTILDLSNSGVETLPREISNLVSLQYLNLSHTWIDKLPVELKMLTKLKCLNLEYDCHLRVIPKQLIYSLSSLQVLKMFRCGYSVEELGDNILSVRNMDINSLLCLKHLQVLSITITCSSALVKFFSNPKLKSCTQSLSLEVFWGSESLDVSPLAAMKNLLTLEIHQAETLQKLSFDMLYAELLKERSFERLEEVAIENCSSLQDLTWVVLAQNLVTLRVKGCEKMKEIISFAELGETLLDPFAKLETLELENLPELKSIYWKALSFGFLKKIKIVDCLLLRELPLSVDRAKTNAMVIEAEEDWWANVEWADDATRTTFQSVFQPLQLGY